VGRDGGTAGREWGHVEKEVKKVKECGWMEVREDRKLQI
jgi:hypothetical protein